VSTYVTQVREYLACCRTAAADLKARGSALDPKYHPTAAGACKLIPHGGDPAEARKIRQAFEALAEQDRERRGAA
jgi:hypothetical protein